MLPASVLLALPAGEAPGGLSLLRGVPAQIGLS